MKLKGIWITICLILVAGVCVTSYTKQYTTEIVELRPSETTAGAMETAAAGDEAAVAPAAAPIPEAAAGKMQVSDETEAAAGGAEAATARMTAVEDAAPANSGSPAGSGSSMGSGSPDVAEAAAESLKASAVMKELQELDEQIARNYASGQDATTNSMKAAAESAWKLWETKMEKFLDKLELKLPAQEKDALFLEQKDWIRDRESEAVAVSRKQSGSALQELEYNNSLKESTRARVYDLANRYGEILSETE